MIYPGDCREGMKMIPDNTFDSIVTDPPYGLSKQPNMHEVLRHWLDGDDYEATGGGFMGKKWDSFVPGPKTWGQAYRVLKPGGYLVAFAGSRTVDLMATSLRLGGFEVVDMLHWLYGVGFPKSLDIGKAIDGHDASALRLERAYAFTEWFKPWAGLSNTELDRLCGTKTLARHWTDCRPNGKQPEVITRDHFEVIRASVGGDVPNWVEAMIDERTVESENAKRRKVVGTHKDTAPAAEWRVGHQGGAVQPPADITAAFSEEAKKWEGWGTALKPCHEPIILCRKPLEGTYANNVMTHGVGALNIDGCRVGGEEMRRTKSSGQKTSDNRSMAGGNYGRVEAGTARGRWPGNVLHDGCLPEPMDRYFYSAKATKADREAGLQLAALTTTAEITGRKEGSAGLDNPRAGTRGADRANTHPTVKPTDLMRWLCRLVTPPGGRILDPFTGSGSTGRGAVLEGFEFTGFELSEEYKAIADARILDAEKEKRNNAES